MAYQRAFIPGYKAKPADPIVANMERKETFIRESQGSKERSIKIQSAGRDAVAITTSFYPELANDPDKENKIRAKIKEWNHWMFNNIYDIPFV